MKTAAALKTAARRRQLGQPGFMGQPVFIAHSTKLRILIARHVDAHYADLPEVQAIGPFLLWFRVCQWNARAALYHYCVDAIREQCTAHKHSCSASAARSHLGEFLGKSERQVLRYMQLLPYPVLHNLKRRNGNGKR